MHVALQIHLCHPRQQNAFFSADVRVNERKFEVFCVRDSEFESGEFRPLEETGLRPQRASRHHELMMFAQVRDDMTQTTARLRVGQIVRENSRQRHVLCAACLTGVHVAPVMQESVCRNKDLQEASR